MSITDRVDTRPPSSNPGDPDIGSWTTASLRWPGGSALTSGHVREVGGKQYIGPVDVTDWELEYDTYEGPTLAVLDDGEVWVPVNSAKTRRIIDEIKRDNPY